MAYRKADQIGQKILLPRRGRRNIIGVNSAPVLGTTPVRRDTEHSFPQEVYLWH
jgi:hypothetical protein